MKYKNFLFLLCFLFNKSFAQVSVSPDIWTGHLRVIDQSPAVEGDWLLGQVKTKSNLYRNSTGNEIVLTNGLVSRTFRLTPNCATVSLNNLMTGESELRAVRPEASIAINGKTYSVGGLVDQPVQNYLTNDFVDKMKADTASFRFSGFLLGNTQERFPWKRISKWSAENIPWPAPGKRLTLSFVAPVNAPVEIKNIKVDVIFEIYDGMPVMSKWIVVENNGANKITLNSVTSEILALAETAPKIDTGEPREYRILGKKNTPVNGKQMDAPRDYIDRFTQLFVVTDYAMGGDMEALKDNPAVRWVHDYPEYARTGIEYYGQAKPARLECTPPIGPDQDIAAGETWESFRAFEMLRDATDQERRGLSENYFWKAMAPWSQENPIFMHVRDANPEAVKLAINQCAEVGFEMVIMTFGSGFNIENKDTAYIDKMKELGNYARSKGIALGGYSLLASRGGEQKDLIISEKTGKPATNQKDGAHFGETPCLATQWGDGYFNQLKSFFEKTGLNVLENDGSYPGDLCASTTHQHKGFEDSQWKQWKKISDFYKWCRGNGIYLNVPDWYFLTGSNKTAMGYVENNWSLPREQQEIIERQNIYDGTWQKTPSMGWMFVPLTEYHGGGQKATIEPLQEHLDHYQRRMENLFGAGVQAAYRGPRLYDADTTEKMVKRMVGFYKQNRAILNSPIIHLRRPDGRDWDGILHVNPLLESKGFAVIYNPTTLPITRNISIPLYYTGLKKVALITSDKGDKQKYILDQQGRVIVTVTIPANEFCWLDIK